MAIDRVTGECRVMFAFEAGASVDLARAAARIPESQRKPLPSARRLPVEIDFAVKPLVVALARGSMPIGNFSTEAVIEATIHDFGAISIAYRIGFAASPDGLRPLAAELWANAALLADARRALGEILSMLGDAVARPSTDAGTAPVEDYVVFVIDPRACPTERSISVESFGAERLAALLSLEDRPLSDEEVSDAVANPIRYSPRDLVLTDWAAAVVVDEEPAATLAVLELANVQLVELKHLDASLDRGLDLVWNMVNERSLFKRLQLRAHLRLVSGLELDGAQLFDGVSNALKLFGDQHLARVQRSASRCLRLEDWHRSIERKLATLDSINERLAARQAQYRSETLEWIIILLILFEVVHAFL
ncbi:MAG: hypothetical protein RL136_1268 [Planctomycetota bacterium]|jgi:hypothetical protein